jgi:EAL domain-containing protein (putative c-di-GMP-specific phosphodiesterase class I)
MTVSVIAKGPRRHHHSATKGALPERELDRILRLGLVRSVYQPLVDLGGGGIVAYEALARGPAGSILESPVMLFETALAAGREVELDWACRAAAVNGAIRAGLPGSIALFVNVEPSSLGHPIPAEHRDTFERAGERLRIVLEITERALASRPAELLAAVETIRGTGWAIALDDVGAEDASAAFMPLLRPDIIKLDLGLIQGASSARAAAQLSAVIAEAERTGAIVLAEGIETEAHERTARALGATIGQGWRFGRPAALPDRFALPATSLGSLRLPETAISPTPIEAIFPGRQPRIATKSDLLGFSRHLERWADAVPGGAVVLAALQDARFLTPATERQYRGLAASSPLVALFGLGLSAEPVPGVRGATLAPDDALRGQWHVVVLGPHFAGALVARELGDSGPDMDRRFEYLITFDREAVIRAARSLMVRIAPIG